MYGISMHNFFKASALTYSRWQDAHYANALDEFSVISNQREKELPSQQIHPSAVLFMHLRQANKQQARCSHSKGEEQVPTLF
jgi:hypothetical protein